LLLIQREQCIRTGTVQPRR